jgi:hypothetical protein
MSKEFKEKKRLFIALYLGGSGGHPQPLAGYLFLQPDQDRKKFRYKVRK